jgi:aldehyde dehydrogenase (NAD+)
VLDNTSSGGVCVNSVVEHLSNPNLPFGGVGESGMGAYHGKFGFDEFSHKRSVMYKDTMLQKGALLPLTGQCMC